MPQIKASASNPLTAFVIDGLEYEKSDFDLFYDFKDFSPPESYDEAKLKVGIEYKSKRETLQDLRHYSEYTDVMGTAYTSREALVADILGLISGGDSISTELQAILDKADLEGFTKPSQSVQDEMGALIGSMKATGIWNKQDLFLNFAYNDVALQDFSRINWKAPSDPLISLFGGLSYDSEGFQGDDVNGYIDTNHNPSTYGGNYLQDNASRFVVMRDLDGGGGINAAIDSEAGGSGNAMHSGGSSAGNRINGGDSTPNTDLSGDGFTMINRTTSTNIQTYKKAVLTNATATSAGVANQNQWLLNILGFFGGNRLSCHGMGGSVLSEAQQFRTDYNTYLVNIGLTAYA